MSSKLCDRISTDPYSTAPTILLIGKAGAGKSTLANMLIGEEKFKTSEGLDTCTNICQNTLINLNSKEYNLVDTPGIFSTYGPNDDEVLGEIAQSIVRCNHGIIAFLFVIEESCRHMIVVFSKCRKRQTKDRYFMEDCFNDRIKSFLDKVGNRWVISPDPDMFEEPKSVVERHMNDLKSYIGLMPKPYTTN
ncbi:22038_t:CDS:2 [Rhizophagus irregularis]|nr:22038_t:CDS:2 [Rhizophagus irregularis]